MNIRDNSKILLGNNAFDKIFSMDCEHISKYLGILERFGGIESEPFTINDICKALKISNKEAIEIIEVLKTVNLIDICNDEFVLIDYRNNENRITLNRATLCCLLKYYNLSPEDIVVAIGLLYLSQCNDGKLINPNYLKNKLLIYNETFELSISKLENKNLIRVNETFLEDEFIKITNYEIYF